LAAHRALIAAANCARRSGERFSFLFGFFVALGFFALARAADFLAAFNAFADSASCSLRFNFASFCGPSRNRFSSSWIFFFNFFSFIFVLLLLGVDVEFKDWGIELMTKSRGCHVLLWRCPFLPANDDTPRYRADELTRVTPGLLHDR
jgi:hypothetical protein